ncbi:hypothetical protein T09_6314 [Trichinella sp. T9]|nr:hypothetical protein T09_6314 [Trichinella sp. T9]
MELKEELIDLQTNEELKPKFKDGYHSFCLEKQISDLYPSLWRMIRNHVDKYVITKHYYQLMPLSLATYDFSVTLSLKRKGSYGVKPQALPSGYARGQIKICIFPQAIPQAIYSTIFDLRGPRRRLRLCPRANKNLHIPAGYAESILLYSYSHGIPSAPASLILEFHTHLFSTYLIYHTL